MLPYWLLYAIVAIPAFVGTGRRNKLSPAIAVGLFFILAIGFREQVGGDWSNYLNHYYHAATTPLKEIKLSDPGYMLLNWLTAKLEWEIYGVNTVCRILFGPLFSGCSAIVDGCPGPGWVLR